MDDLVGTFGSPAAGERAREALLQAGIDGRRIVVSVWLTEDGIGAEYPGQSYEHQDYRSSDQVRLPEGWTDTDRARYGEEVRSAACVVSVRLEHYQELARVERVLLSAGARRAMKRPRA